MVLVNMVKELGLNYWDQSTTYCVYQRLCMGQAMIYYVSIYVSIQTLPVTNQIC